MMDDDMRQYRHDNRHHRAVLRELASKGDLEEIKDYLVQLSEQDEDLKKKMCYIPEIIWWMPS